jgi:hypothetical protein
VLSKIVYQSFWEGGLLICEPRAFHLRAFILYYRGYIFFKNVNNFAMDDFIAMDEHINDEGDQQLIF